MQLVRMGERELGKRGGDINRGGDRGERVDGVRFLVGGERFGGVIDMLESSYGAGAAHRSEGERLLLGEWEGFDMQESSIGAAAAQRSGRERLLLEERGGCGGSFRA